MTVQRTSLGSILAIALYLAVSHECASAGVSDVVPKPIQSIPAPGIFELTEQTVLMAGPGAQRETQQLASWLRVSTGYELSLVGAAKTNGILLELDRSLEAPLGAISVSEEKPADWTKLFDGKTRDPDEGRGPQVEIAPNGDNSTSGIFEGSPMLHFTPRFVDNVFRHLSVVALLFVAWTWTEYAAATGDVNWLADVTTAPTNPPAENPGKLAPLLMDDSGQAITTRDGWERQRRNIRDAWLRFLGPMPGPRPPVHLEVLRTETCGAITRQLVRYEGEPGLFVEGYLLLPHGSIDGQEEWPGIVALHQTTTATIDEIAGVSGPDSLRIGLKLANRGFVVFCPRCFLWQDVTSLEQAVDRHRERHPQSLGMAKMLYDAMRGVDVLESIPNVDKQRIGAVGHSLGAKETLYLAAFDERVKAAVASEGGITFPSTNWDAPWYLGEAIRDESLPLNHHQLLGLIAPRPFLILGGQSGPGAADGDRSWPLIIAAWPAWRLYDEPIRLGLYNHRQGHSLSPEAFDRLADWLEVYLAR